MGGFLTNGLPRIGQAFPQMQVNLDTEFPRGANPQSVAGTAFQTAAVLAEALQNMQTSTAGTATSNTFGGMVVTESLSTAPNSDYIFTLNNNLITKDYLSRNDLEWPYDWSGWPAGHNWPWPYGRHEAMLREKPEASIFSISNTGGNGYGIMSALMALVNVQTQIGQVKWTWKNMGLTALNGTMAVMWHL